MADSTLDSELFVLYDNWPGTPDPTLSTPVGGFTGSEHHNVAAAIYDVGQKIRVYNTGVTAGKPGYSTFVYLKAETTDAPTMAAKQLIVPDSATVWYEVTNDPDSCVDIAGGLTAVALSAMTDAYYGWFWCGGVCPEEFVSGLGGNFATEGNVVAGEICAHDLGDADAIGLGPSNPAAKEVAIGYALAADAA